MACCSELCRDMWCLSLGWGPPPHSERGHRPLEKSHFTGGTPNVHQMPSCPGNLFCVYDSQHGGPEVYVVSQCPVNKRILSLEKMNNHGNK